MGKGSLSPEALAPQRPVADLCHYLAEVVGGAIDESLLQRALTHRSYAYEAGGAPHNERLEFLGDSVLGLVVTDALYQTHPDLSEGQLAKLRAAVVNMRALAEVGRTLGLGDYLFLGRGEVTTGGRDKDSILADTVEAVIGATYLCGGLERAGALVHHLVDPLMARSVTLGAGLDWKTSLQEVASLHEAGVVSYHVTEDGPEHAKTFTARAVVGECTRGHGVGRTKKDAEQKAAAQAWQALQDDAGQLSATPGLDALGGVGGVPSVGGPGGADTSSAAANSPADCS